MSRPVGRPALYAPACSVPGCGKPHQSLGYCNPHAKRLKRYGDPLTVKWEQHGPRAERACMGCGAVFTPPTRTAVKNEPVFCSRECVPARERSIFPACSIFPTTCATCFRHFCGRNNRSRACSAPCRKEMHSAYEATKRARTRGGRVEAVKAFIVFERDGWRCRLCGVPTPKRLRGLRVANAPELDHVVPLARGGTHTWDNVQCACMHCNRSKNATTRGQLGLGLVVA